MKPFDFSEGAVDTGVLPLYVASSLLSEGACQRPSTGLSVQIIHKSGRPTPSNQTFLNLYLSCSTI